MPKYYLRNSIFGLAYRLRLEDIEFRYLGQKQWFWLVDRLLRSNPGVISESSTIRPELGKALCRSLNERIGLKSTVENRSR
jgi:hypothetical protein